MDASEKEHIQEVFGEVIKELRNQKNISQIELAERGQFNRTYISDLERGLKQASLSTILRLAGALDVQPHELIMLLERRIEDHS